MQKIFTWIINIIFGLLLILAILVSISKFSNFDTVFGFTPLKVLSGSMEPAIRTGDLIIVKKTDVTNIKNGDIVTYKINSDSFVTHRVVGISNEDGEPRFKTKGDANNIEDKGLILGKDIVGKYMFRIPKIGLLSSLMRRPIGFLLFFILPIIFLLRKEIINLKKA